MKKHIKQLIIPLLFIGCIGTDILDDEIVGETIVVEPNEMCLMLDDQLQLSGEYHNKFGILTEVDFVWEVVDNTILSVDDNGLVTTVNTGQTIITASFGQAISKEVLITVVADVNDLGSVTINQPTSSQLNGGEMLQLSAAVWNCNKEELFGKIIEWSSSDETIATVNETGLITAVGDGLVQITASSEGIEGQFIDLQVGSSEKTASFSGSSGYTAEGTATLKTDENGDLILELSSDFRTSFALGTFIYLSNTISGSGTRSGGLELEQITSNGAKSFNVSAKEAGVNLDTYQYVIVLCKPASITFGTANFNE